MEARSWFVDPERLWCYIVVFEEPDGIISHFRISIFSHLPFFIPSSCYKYVAFNLLFPFPTRLSTLSYNHDGGGPSQTIEGF
jgi:hypothetical protein